MPVVTETVVAGYGHCIDPRCAGYKQQPADVVVTVQAFSYRELGGDLPGNERETHDVFRFADPDAEAACVHCGQPRIPSDQVRPEYAPLSGQDPLALLNLNQQGRINDMQMQNLERDKELAEMRATMAEMRAELQRRRGGRPKNEDE